MTQFGNFTANFREAPSPLPPEFWAQMYAVIATIITALFIPSIVGWFKSKREAKKLNDFHHKQIADLHKQIAVLHQVGKLDGKGIKALDDLRNRIENAYPEGKLNEKHYESLRGKISGLYKEVFRKRIDDAVNKTRADKKALQEQLAPIKNEVQLAYSDGKINDEHYDLLNKAISNLDNEQRDAS